MIINKDFNLGWGDCLELLKRIPDNSIDMCLTDPPYKLVSGGRKGKNTPIGGVFGKNELEMKKGTVFKENSITFKEWLPEIYRVLKDDTHLLIFINNRNLFELRNEAVKYFKFKNLITWDKKNKNPNRSYMIQTEFILMLGKGKCRGIKNMGESNLISMTNRICNKQHPTQKPIKLLTHLINQSSDINNIILDPFMGSGSTGVASANLNRKFIGIEKDNKYFKIAVKRILEAKPSLKENISLFKEK